MECPICGENATLKSKKESYNFRKKDFEILAQYFECDKCKELFSNTELDERNIQQVYNLYRQDNKILFPQEIEDIRNQFGLSRRKMSQVLGWGENTYANYEKGTIPDESHNNLLSLMKQPDQFLKIVGKKKEIFTKKEYETLYKKIIELEANEKEIWFYYFSFNFSIDEFTGFLKPTYEKLLNTILYFLEKDVSYIVRLNKYMFYADFLSYKLYRKPITGYHYAAIPMGPILQDYRTLINKLESDEYLSTVESFVKNSGEVVEKLVPGKKIDLDVFSREEFDILEKVIDVFKNMNTSEIVEFSHKEIGWLENKDSKSLISYQKYADTLQLE